MRRGALLITLLAVLYSTSGAFALKLGEARPKITVYRASAAQVVVYDARPELGVATRDMSKRARDAVADLGVRLVRHTLYWNKMETTENPGLYDSKYLGEWDALVEECRKEGTHLVVAIDGDPPGLSAGNLDQAYRRLARFAADMAARYPSVVYWEPLGGNYGQMLQVVYPAIKAANPAAWVLCPCRIDQDEFARELCKNGAANYFDILDVHAYSAAEHSAFVDGGKRLNGVMAEYGDQTKPVWGTLFSTTNTSTTVYEGYFQKNNDLYVYQKVIVALELGDGDAVQSPLYKWLDESDVNRAILDKPRNVANVFVAAKVPMVPVGYDYKAVEDGIEIHRVLVDTLAPTRIDLMFAAEPSSPGPGEKAAPPKRKGTRPIPDPWDI